MNRSKQRKSADRSGSDEGIVSRPIRDQETKTPVLRRSPGSSFYNDGFGFLEDAELPWVCPI